MLIEATNLRKEYLIPISKKSLLKCFFTKKIKKVAIENISLKINKGEIVGYIGLNGAGKSTTIKLLTGIISPTSGSVRINGKDPFKNRMDNAKMISVMFGQRSQLIWDLPVYRSFDFLLALYKVDKNNNKDYLKELYSTLNIAELFNIPVRLLSLGQRMRCEFCSILLHKPQIIYLDEPTMGMDVLLRADFKLLIKQINKELSTTILFTSHDLNEIEEVCERIIIIDKGTILFDGTIQELKLKYQIKKKVVLEFYKPTSLDEFNLNEIEKNSDTRHIYCLNSCSDNIIESINQINSKYPVSNVEIIDGKLEDIVKKIYR